MCVGQAKTRWLKCSWVLQDYNVNFGDELFCLINLMSWTFILFAQLIQKFSRHYTQVLASDEPALQSKIPHLQYIVRKFWIFFFISFPTTLRFLKNKDQKAKLRTYFTYSFKDFPLKSASHWNKVFFPSFISTLFALKQLSIKKKNSSEGCLWTGVVEQNK